MAPRGDKALLIENFRQRVRQASKEAQKKELFKDLLRDLFGHDPDNLKVLDQFTLGAEFGILNISRKDGEHRGSADTLYNNLIIEFENDLKRSLEHAKEQLSGYLLGHYLSIHRLVFILGIYFLFFLVNK